MNPHTHCPRHREGLLTVVPLRISPCSLAIGLVLAACALGASAASLSSNLTEQGRVANQPQQFVQLFNARDMTPAAHVQMSSQGDEVLSVLSLQGSQGLMTLSEHACSGPPPGSNAGTADASGVLNYAESFTITSTTLSPGTPVSIAIRIATASKVRASLVYPNPASPPGSDFADVFGHVGIRIDAAQTSAATFQGDLSAKESGLHPSSVSVTGILGGGTFSALVVGQVGQSFGFNIQSSFSAGSRAIIGNTSDADAQIALLWGAEVVGGGATLQGDGGFVFPSLGGVTPDRALANLPPPPVVNTPEPSSILMFAAGMAVLIGQKKRRAGSRFSPWNATPVPALS